MFGHKVITLLPSYVDKVNKINISYPNILLFLSIWDNNRIMPTEKPTITFIADEDLIERINDFRFTKRIKNQSEAIRQLLRKALDLYEEKPKK